MQQGWYGEMVTRVPTVRETVNDKRRLHGMQVRTGLCPNRGPIAVDLMVPSLRQYYRVVRNGCQSSELTIAMETGPTGCIEAVDTGHPQRDRLRALC